MADPDLEWEHRRLCTDGACIGVIGAEGRCNVCGKLAPESGGPFRAAPLDGEMAVNVVDDDADDAAAAGTDDLLAADDDFEAERELCPDDACIGLLGDDGRCKVCGMSKAAETV